MSNQVAEFAESVLCRFLFEGKIPFNKLWVLLNLRAELDLRSTNVILLEFSKINKIPGIVF